MKKKWRISLATKLNLLIAVLLLAMAAGLVQIMYLVNGQQVNQMYFDNAERYARLALENIYPDDVEDLIAAVESEEFPAIREKALAENDENIIKDWLARREGALSMYFTVWDEAEMLLSSLEDFRKDLGIHSTYIQYVKGGVTYNLLDPTESMLIFGSVEDMPEFRQYTQNERIPATPCHYKDQWLCTAMEPIVQNGVAIAAVGVDLDMNDLMARRKMFLIDGGVFVALLTLAAMLLTIFCVRRVAIRPIKQLAGAACSFAVDEDLKNVQNLNIRSNDELGDLAREIESMQSRILDYTDNLTRITAERERASTEMRMATQIQAAMLPSTFPPFPGVTAFDLYAIMDPAKEVGGDFYDFLMPDPNHLVVLIADVSDKGVPAALFMMSSKIIINYRAQLGGTPAEILEDVNRLICRNNKQKMFVTVWLGILDLKTGEMTCASAGHEYPFLRTGGQPFQLYKDPHGLAIGALPVSRYKNYTINLQPGDALFVYTDGVPEASRARNDFFGLERTAQSLNARPDADAKALLEGVKADIDAFVGDARQFDDLTMLSLIYAGGAR